MMLFNWLSPDRSCTRKSLREMLIEESHSLIDGLLFLLPLLVILKVATYAGVEVKNQSSYPSALETLHAREAMDRAGIN